MNKETEIILSKRFQTTMIGALYEFEKTFGYLWGHHKDINNPLTEKEEQFLNLWEDTRNQILNNGNNQLRKAISEVKKTEGRSYNYSFQNKKGNFHEK